MKHFFNLYLDSFRGLSPAIWWLALITLINRAGTMVVPFLSLYLTEDLDLSLENVGWIMSAFGLGSVVGSWLGGKFTDKIGAYKIMVFSLIISGFSFIALQYIHSFTGFCIGIFILTVIADMFRPAIFVALEAYSKPENKTRSVTLIRLAINLGFSAGPALGGLIILQLGYGGLFWVDGITCIAAGFLIIGILNPKRAPVREVIPPDNPKSAYKDGTYLLFIVAMFLFGLVFLQYFSTIPLYYKVEHQLTEFEIGLLFGCNGFLIFLFEMPLVKWLENINIQKSTLILIGCLMVGVSFVLLNMTDWTGIVVISMFLITVGEMVAFPFSNALAMDRSSLGNKGQYMALYMMAFSFGHIISHNSGMQLIADMGFEFTWYSVAAISGIAVLLLFRLRKA